MLTEFRLLKVNRLYNFYNWHLKSPSASATSGERILLKLCIHKDPFPQQAGGLEKKLLILRQASFPRLFSEVAAVLKWDVIFLCNFNYAAGEIRSTAARFPEQAGWDSDALEHP